MKTIHNQLKNTQNKFVVVLGASAGGLEAIHDFFDNANNLMQISFVVIQHLSPDHKSLLVELVSKHTEMNVIEAGQGMSLSSNCVYIIPNNKLLSIYDNKFELEDKVDLKKPNTAIDTFLFSLAEDRGDKAIAIILSGTGSDGTKGIEAIKNVGGTVIVQDPSSAKFDGMPNSAIGAGNVDFILDPKEMPALIEKLVKDYYIEPQDVSLISDAKMEKIFSLIYNQSGHDFNYYKTPTIIRRIEKRMVDIGINNLDKYIDLLENNEGEVKKLGAEFLIGVTCFFRDKPAFALMESEIIPNLLKDKKNKDILKVWVCACSTGEEAFSLAIVIDKCLRIQLNKPEIKIFATDIDENSLKIAQKGEYPLSISKEVDAETLSEYFIRNKNSYTIIPRIRRQIVFAQHNVIKNPPFIKNDLISCRNMLIYVNPILQNKLLATFHFSLSAGGYLFLGSSESANYIKDGVIEIDGKNKIYQKISETNFLTQELSRNVYPQRIERSSLENRFKPKNSLQKNNSEDVEFYNLLLEDLNYVGVYIDNDFNIKDTIGDFKRYLSLPEKKLNLNILKMVSVQISSVLSTAVRKARKSGETIILYKEIKNQFEQNIFCRLVIKPLQEKRQFLILFSEAEQKKSVQEDENIVLLTDLKQSEYIQEIEAELSETKSDLQYVMEEMETANEELQSSNEELLSANEELQSSNEELQSLNEELHTLNAEHQLKIKELTDLNDDLDNYFRSTDLGQIFVDKDLRIRKFNPAAIKMINLISSDIGRPIEHISTNILQEDIINDIKKIIEEEESVIEKEIVLRNGTKRMLRILPYIRQDKIRDGAVISFLDITAIIDLNNMIKSAFNASKSAIIAYTAVRDIRKKIVDFKCLTSNSVALRKLKTTDKEIEGMSIRDILPEISKKELFEKYVDVVEKGAIFQTEFENNELSWSDIVAVKMGDGFVITITDISYEKLASVKLQKTYDDLLISQDSLQQINDGLEIEIKDKTKELSNSEERFSLISKVIADSVWDWDLKTNVIWRSSNFVNIFGYVQNKETSNFDFWISKIHPEEREIVKNSVYNAIEKYNEWSAEYRFLKKDGTYAYVLDRAQILRDKDNIPYRILGSVVDISTTVELNKMVEAQQEEFRRIFLNAPSHIIIKRGEDLKYEFVNNEAAEFYHLYDVIGKPVASVKLNWDGADLSKKEFKVLKTGKAISEKAYRITYFNKETKTEINCWFNYTIEPVFDHNGVINGVVTFAFNVTDMIKAQAETNLLLEKKDEFLSIASHELKTPLTSVKGFMQLLLKKNTTDEELKPLSELVLKSNNQINKLSSLINDLLDVTKIQSERLKLSISSFNSRQLIVDSLEGFTELRGKHKITVETNDDIMLHADKNVLEQVINNFISNAIKYSPNLTEIVVRSEMKGGMYYFSVKDFGIGIPQEKTDFVFQRFFRVNDTSEYYTGLGLGLYISSEIIKKHKGRIGCTSKLGEGSLFWFTIPLIYFN